MLKIQAAGLSDRGMKRPHNEDSLSVVPSLSLFIVADGMGGHNAGEVASSHAVTVDRCIGAEHTSDRARIQTRRRRTAKEARAAFQGVCMKVG